MYKKIKSGKSECMKTFVRLILGHLSLLSSAQSFSSFYRESKKHITAFTIHWSRLASPKMSNTGPEDNVNLNTIIHSPSNIESHLDGGMKKESSQSSTFMKEAIKRKDGAYLVVGWLFLDK